MHVVLCAVAAREVGRPVKLVLTRDQMFSSTGHRPRTEQDLILVADGDGHILSTEHHTLTETSTVAHFLRTGVPVHPVSVQLAAPRGVAPHRAAQRADPVLHARTRGGPRSLRSRGGDRRARLSGRCRPGGTTDPQPRGDRPGKRQAVALPGNTPDVDNTLQPGELILGIELPPSDLADHSWYLKVRDRHSYAFALVSVAAGLRIADGVIASAALALGAVAAAPWRLREAEESLIGRRPDDDTFHAAAALAMTARNRCPRTSSRSI